MVPDVEFIVSKIPETWYYPLGYRLKAYPVVSDSVTRGSIFKYDYATRVDKGNMYLRERKREKNHTGMVYKLCTLCSPHLDAPVRAR